MTVLTMDDAALGDIAQRALAGTSGLPGPLACPGPVYIALRRGGVRRWDGWAADTDLAGALRGAAGRTGAPDFDAVELCLSHDYRRIDPARPGPALANAYRGIYGIEIGYRGSIERYAPTLMIANNLGFGRALEKFRRARGLSAAAFARDGGLRRFSARQVLIRPGRRPAAMTLHRGNRIVGIEAVTAETVAEMAAAMADWLLRHVGPDGRLCYKYWPSRGRESTADNTIRQFMATLCLARLARRGGPPAAAAAADRNLAYNLRTFFRVRDGVGTIEHGGKAKLGAAALAAHAILEHPNGERHGEAFALLCRGVEALWRPDGSFRTFHLPAARNDNQNFYPGEALRFWAALLGRRPDARLLSRCMRSFAFYRDRHRQARNPAFVPWHSQAWAELYRQTGTPALRDFVFEMNDWLLAIQQWDGAPFADMRGRFYDPGRPDFGPPHASSTGVYLEGLADAFRLARDGGDGARTHAYARAIWRGLRSVRQLQFRDDVDAFYVSKRARVDGAVRTEVYDNTIRVDNVQHCLDAITKVQELPQFPSPAEAESAAPRPVG